MKTQAKPWRVGWRLIRQAKATLLADSNMSRRRGDHVMRCDSSAGPLPLFRSRRATMNGQQNPHFTLLACHGSMGIT